MVKVKLVIIALVLSACSSSKTQKIKYNKLEVKDGWQLNYNLISGGERYQYIVNVLQMDPDRSFRYRMTNTREYSSIYTITKKGLDSAIKEQNYFSPYNDTLPEDQTTVWLSRWIYSSIMKTDSVTFIPDMPSFGRGEMTTFYFDGEEAYSYELNGVPQTIKAIRIRQKGGSMNFLILKDPEYPLIIEMDVGWKIWLKEINHN